MQVITTDSRWIDDEPLLSGTPRQLAVQKCFELSAPWPTDSSKAAAVSPASTFTTLPAVQLGRGAVGTERTTLAPTAIVDWAGEVEAVADCHR